MTSTDALREREEELLRRWDELKDTDHPERSAVRDELITMHLPLVRYVARRYTGRGESPDDIMQVGTIGLMKAIDRFDGARGVAFSSFATPTIVGEIKRHFRDHTWSIHVPRPLKERGTKVSNTAESLAITLGRAPTVQEIAVGAGLEVGAVLEAMEASHAYAPLPLETPSGSYVVEPISDESTLFGAVEDRETLLPLIRALSEQQQQVLQMRFSDEMSQTEIGEVLGISQMQVSRILGQCMSSLRIGLQDAGDLRGERDDDAHDRHDEQCHPNSPFH